MNPIRPLLITAFLALGALVFAACGSDPTATPRPTSTPTPVPTPTATLAPGVPTPTPRPTATPRPPTPTPSRDMEAYFSDQTIRVAVGFSPGGGYDAFARLFGAFAPKHFPGTPKFVVRNMDGAGGERIFKEVDKATGGRTVGVSHPRFFKRELLGTDVEYLDLATIKIVGTPTATNTATAYYVFKDFATDWESAVATGDTMTSGNTAIGDTGGVGVAFVELVGGPMKQVSGYGGTSEIAAAFDRREITGTSRGNYTSAFTLFPEWITGQQIVPLFRWGADPEDDPRFVEYVTKDLGGVVPPHIYEAMAAIGINVTEGQKAVFNLTETVNNSLSRTFILSKDTPDDIVEVWRSSFKATVEDPAFVAAAALLERPVAYGSPDAIVTALNNGLAALSDPALASMFGQMAGTE